MTSSTASSPCSVAVLIDDNKKDSSSSSSTAFPFPKSRNEFVAAAIVIKLAPTIPNGVNSSPNKSLANIAPNNNCERVAKKYDNHEKTCRRGGAPLTFE